MLFANPDGTPWENRNIQKKFKKWQETYILPDGSKLSVINPYRLRHYSCTYKLQLCKDFKAVQNDMGHADLELIHKRYTMLEESGSRFIANKMEEAYITSPEDLSSDRDRIDVISEELSALLSKHPEKTHEILQKLFSK